MTNFVERVPFVFLFCALFLSACVNQTASFSVPEKVLFQNKVFEKMTHSELGDMQQMLYLASGTAQNPDDWQQGVLIFLDRNTQGRTIAERMALRQASFAAQDGTLANVTIQGEELQSQVIYPPTARFANVQLEVSRGRESLCGFSQMQFADKRSVLGEKTQELESYRPILANLMQQFEKLDWQILCRK